MTIHENKWWWGIKYTFILYGGAAFCHLELPFEENFAWISDVCVLPDYRRRGWGNMLLDQAIKKAKESGKPVVRLSVDNEWAQAWYERRGFKEIGFTPDGLPLLEMPLSVHK